VRTLRDEVETERQVALEGLDLAALLLKREQVLKAAAPVAGGVKGRLGWRRVHLHLQSDWPPIGLVCTHAGRGEERRGERLREGEGNRSRGVAYRKRIFWLLFLHRKTANGVGWDGNAA
jgi:hypothetical protein